MTDHARLSKLFLQACALPPEERPDFLDQACGGDAALRAELQAMLAADAQASGILDGRVGAVAADATGGRPATPRWIGPYRILGLLGEGGMGVVYHAEQQAPVRREVALKLVRGGLESAGAVARFEAERQALAQMEHPSIARLFDAGTTDDGRPYFVMELVRGAPITEHCRTHRLGVRDRVSLFLEVCRAVRHAHRRGVIHRDLKPSNILVAPIGDRPVPKVIDFSIAKALGASALHTEFRTRTGQVVGTLEYMSPEQAMGRVEAVDTRSDVYALGCVLYELLADRPPQEVGNLPLHEAVQRIVRDPPRPLRGAGTTTAHRLDADLDTIVGKCLEKASERRYGSAAELVEDLERYLDSRPILARPPSTVYQLRKLVDRHRVGFLLAGLAFAFLVVFSITVTIQLANQRRERTRAEAQARKADRVTRFLQDAFKAASEDRGHDATVKQTLDLAAADLDREKPQDAEADVAIRQTLGAAFTNFGEHAKAERLMRQTLAMQERRLGPGHAEVGTAHQAVAVALMGAEKAKEAEPEARAALRIHEAQESPDWNLVAGDMGLLAAIRLLQGDEAGAEELIRRSIAILEEKVPKTEAVLAGMADAKESLADVLQRRGAVAESEAMVREVLALRRRTAGPAGNTALATTLSNLAFLTGIQEGRPEEALPLYREALEMLRRIRGPTHAQVGDLLSQQASCLRQLRRYGEAETALKEAANIERQALGEDSPGYSWVLVDLTDLYLDEGRLEDALRVCRESLEIQQKLNGNDSPVVAQRWRKLGTILETQGRYAEAEAAFRTPLPVADKLPKDDLQVAWIVGALASFLADHGRFHEAWPLSERSFPIGEKRLDAENPVRAVGRIKRARILDGLGRFEEGHALRAQGLATLRKVTQDRDDWIGFAFLDEAKALDRQGRLGEAAQAAGEAVAAWHRLLGPEEQDPRLAPALLELADLQARRGEVADARAQARAALAAWAKAPFVEPAQLARARELVAR